jgi:histidine triad (HIT) family protein
MDSEKAEHVYSLVSGNSVSHLHMHLTARYPNTPEEYWGPMDAMIGKMLLWEITMKSKNSAIV